jgi:hypothetical protein
MKRLEIKDIRRDPATQMREKLDQATVSRFAEAMEEGDGIESFPEIVVFFDGKVNWLADGWHRVAAFEKTGMKGGIPASVRKGGVREATLFAIGANAEHGLPRSNADKRKAVRTILADDEWVGWSDGVIARRAKVSQPFVSALRRETENLVPPEKGERGKATQNVLSARPAKRVGADGVARSTAKIGKAKQRKKTRKHPCRKCGCTDSKPCPGGCYWVEDDLCSSCAPAVTDKRRVNEDGTARSPVPAGPAPGMIGEGKKEKPIAELLNGKPLYIQFIFIPKVPGVTVSVSRGPGSEATRQTMATHELPRMPQMVLAQIVEQLNGKGK